MGLSGKKVQNVGVSSSAIEIKKQISSNTKNSMKESLKLSKKRKLGIIILAVFVISVIVNSSIRLFYIKSVSGSATWVETNGQTYLDVSADNSYDLGYLTGQKLSLKILGLKTILSLMAGSYDTNYKELIEDAREYLNFIPSEHLEEMQGLADGASNSLGIPFSFEDILLQNTFIDILYGDKIPGTPDPIGCTIVAANNSEKSIEFGQNFDFPDIFKLCTSFVLHKLGEKPAIFGIKFGAALNYPLAKNENGVSVLTSVVSINIQSEPIIPVSCRTRIALENATSAESFKDIFFDYFGTNPVGGLTITAVDDNNIISIDSIPSDTLIVYPETIVKSNTFVEESWQDLLVKPEYSKDRQEKAEELLSESYLDSYLTSSELLAILKNPLICQKKVGDTAISTLGFFTSLNFGLGYTDTVQMGIIPI